MSNTYIESGTHRSRIHYPKDRNKTLRAIITRFSNESNVAPHSFNFTEDTNNFNVPNGTLYWDNKVGALYVWSTHYSQGTHLGGSWTRNGINISRLENGAQAMLANVAYIETGSLVCTATTDSSLRSNAALHLKTTSADVASSLINLSSTNLLVGSITTSVLSDSAVTTNKLTEPCVYTSKIGSGTVTSTNLSTNSVTTTKVKNSNITNSKLAANSIDTNKIQNNAVNTNKLGTINTNNISNGVVTSQKISNGAITNNKVGNEEILGNKFTVNTIGTREMNITGIGGNRKPILFNGSGGFKYGTAI